MHPLASYSSRLLWLARFACLGLGAGCASSGQSAVVGDETVIERSREEKPTWLGDPNVCGKGLVCAIGSRTRSAAVEYGRTDAFNDALKDFGRRLQSRAKSVFSSARTEGRLPQPGQDPVLDTVLEELYAAFSKVTVEDVHVEDFYWTRTRALGDDGRARTAFDYSVLVSIPETTWRKKIEALLASQRASDPEHEALRQKLDTFTNDLVNEPQPQ